MTTFLELQNRVYAHLRDSEHDFYETDLIKSWLNDALTDLSVRLRLYQRVESGVVIGSGLAALPTDLQLILEVRLDGAETLERVSDEVFYSWVDSALTPSQTVYRIFDDFSTNRQIEMYPTPADTSTLEIFYVGYPPLMDSDDDVPTLPFEWVPRLTYYALAQAYMQKDDPASSDRWLARYETDLPITRGNMPAPFTMTIDPGPFDRPASYVDADDPQHI
jgi:hypothetical protein